MRNIPFGTFRISLFSIRILFVLLFETQFNGILSLKRKKEREKNGPILFWWLLAYAPVSGFTPLYHRKKGFFQFYPIEIHSSIHYLRTTNMSMVRSPFLSPEQQFYSLYSNLQHFVLNLNFKLQRDSEFVVCIFWNWIHNNDNWIWCTWTRVINSLK